MAFTGINYFSAVLITSANPERLYEFYKNKLKLPLEPEQHGDTKNHYGCELGDLHFAIHPLENFNDGKSGVGSIKMAFEVFDIEDFARQLKEQGIELVHPIKSMGPMLITAITDPDGNYIEFTQLGERWISYLEGRREKGFDLISEFKSRKK
jgi:predicted enzyme related to lactoylglutathione lyase